ncbi:MAG TPA: hypothetical protein VF103_06445 [Polyangiaceae bacterium]
MSARKDSPEGGAGERAAAFFSERYLSLDVRFLGLFRIALGILLMVEVLRRLYYARAFYTNDGFLPNHFSLYSPMGRSVFSIYHAFSTYGEVRLAFGLTFLVFLAFTLGYRTRLFHVVSAICITSLNSRNLFVENGGTVVVNILTIYTMFLPLGERFSLDAVRTSLGRRADASVLDLNRPDPLRKPRRAVSLVVLLLLIQWSAIYFFNTVQKDGEGWKNGTALHWFFHQDRIVTVFGIWAREHLPLSVLRLMTYGALVVEGSLSALILFPFLQKWTRRTVFVLVWSLHGFIALSARLGPFSYAMMLFPLLLLGADDFDWLTRLFRSEARSRSVVVDPRSPLAFQVARILDRFDPFDRLTFVDRRESAYLPANAPSDALFVVDGEGRVFRGARALGEIARALPFGIVARAIIALPGLNALVRRACGRFETRDLDWGRALGIARKPRNPALASAVELEAPTPFALGFRAVLASLREGAVVLLGLAVISAILVQNPYVARHVRVHRAEWMIDVIEYPRLLQGWSMFAPEPPYEDGRIVVDGRTADGRKYDPFADGPPNFDTEAPNGWGHSQFWCDYHLKIHFTGNASHKQHLQHYLLHQHEWSGHPENELTAFDVWWVGDRTPQPGETHGEPLKPEKILSYGRVPDSGADDRRGPLQAEQRRSGDVPLHGP